jgi:hypothetical protein
MKAVAVDEELHLCNVAYWRYFAVRVFFPRAPSLQPLCTISCVACEPDTQWLDAS